MDDFSGFVGMATKFAEIALGIKYRKIHKDGTVSGGYNVLFGRRLAPKMAWYSVFDFGYSVCIC